MTAFHIFILIMMIVVSIGYLVGCVFLGMLIAKIGLAKKWTFIQEIVNLILASFFFYAIFQFIIWLLKLALS